MPQQSLYHIIIVTKGEEPTLTVDGHKKLFRFIWGMLKNKECELHRIGGADNHIHIATSLHPSIALDDLVRDIKLSTSSMINATKLFTDFSGWESEYESFTHSENDKQQLIDLIKSQKDIHQKKSFGEELRELPNK